MRHPERVEQTKLVAMLRQLLPDLRFLAIPLGEHRDKRTAAILKAMGTSPGWPDLFFPSLNLWVEMKAPDGDLSAAQEEVIAFLRREQYYVWIAIKAKDTFELLKLSHEQRTRHPPV